MSEIPHPFIEETVHLFKDENTGTKNKIFFIHFNHTNPTLQNTSKEKMNVEKLGFKFAFERMQLDL